MPHIGLFSMCCSRQYTVPRDDLPFTLLCVPVHKQLPKSQGISTGVCQGCRNCLWYSANKLVRYRQKKTGFTKPHRTVKIKIFEREKQWVLQCRKLLKNCWLDRKLVLGRETVDCHSFFFILSFLPSTFVFSI